MFEVRGFGFGFIRCTVIVCMIQGLCCRAMKPQPGCPQGQRGLRACERGSKCPA